MRAHFARLVGSADARTRDFAGAPPIEPLACTASRHSATGGGPQSVIGTVTPTLSEACALGEIAISAMMWWWTIALWPAASS